MAPTYPRLLPGGYRLKATRAEARRAIARLWQRVRSSVERAVTGCPAHRWRVRWVQGPLLNSFCCVSQQVVSSGRPAFAKIWPPPQDHYLALATFHATNERIDRTETAVNSFD